MEAVFVEYGRIAGRKTTPVRFTAAFNAEGDAVALKCPSSLFERRVLVWMIATDRGTSEHPGSCCVTTGRVAIFGHFMPGHDTAGARPVSEEIMARMRTVITTRSVSVVFINLYNHADDTLNQIVGTVNNILRICFITIPLTFMKALCTKNRRESFKS